MRNLMFALSVVFAGSNLKADTLLDTGPGNRVTALTAFNGVGQRAPLQEYTTLTSFAMDFDLTSSGDITFMVFDYQGSKLLFSETQGVAASSTLSFVSSTPFSLNLNSGTYTFAVISDADPDTFNISFFLPPNGNCCVDFYDNFASPTLVEGGSWTIPLELFGTSLPEPSALGLVGAALGFLAWKRLGPRARSRAVASSDNKIIPKS